MREKYVGTKGGFQDNLIVWYSVFGSAAVSKSVEIHDHGLTSLTYDQTIENSAGLSSFSQYRQCSQKRDSIFVESSTSIVFPYLIF